MKKLYTFLLVALVVAAGAVAVGCSDDADVVPMNLDADAKSSDQIDMSRMDPTDPPDSTYDPFKD